MSSAPRCNLKEKSLEPPDELQEAKKINLTNVSQGLRPQYPKKSGGLKTQRFSSVCFRAPVLPPFSLILPPSFPFSPCPLSYPISPLHLPCFRYSSVSCCEVFSRKSLERTLSETFPDFLGRGPFPVSPYPQYSGGAISPPKFLGWSVRNPLFYSVFLGPPP